MASSGNPRVTFVRKAGEKLSFGNFTLIEIPSGEAGYLLDTGELINASGFSVAPVEVDYIIARPDEHITGEVLAPPCFTAYYVRRLLAAANAGYNIKAVDL